MEKDIKELRREIDAIDEEMVKLFCRRMETARGVADYKIRNSLPVYDAKREREKLCEVASMAPADMQDYVCTLYNTLFDVSRAEQESKVYTTSDTAELIEKAMDETPKQFPSRATVACQGVEGAYSQIAAGKLFDYPTISYHSTFEDVFRAIEDGKCKYGVLPIENSNAGSVKAVYDLMLKYRFYIVKSTRIHIDHQLLAKSGVALSDIKEVISHQQAIDQSDEFLKSLGVKVTACRNTAEAAKTVADSDRNDIAALSSRRCAELYGLEVLKSSVQDNGNNHTRFICISKEPEIYPGADRTSIMLVTPHRPGALFSVMARFNALGINLTKLESRPIPDRDFEFMFYFDLDASVYSDSFRRLICGLDNTCEEFRYLGSYTETV